MAPFQRGLLGFTGFRFSGQRNDGGVLAGDFIQDYRREISLVCLFRPAADFRIPFVFDEYRNGVLVIFSIRTEEMACRGKRKDGEHSETEREFVKHGSAAERRCDRCRNADSQIFAGNAQLRETGNVHRAEFDAAFELLAE